MAIIFLSYLEALSFRGAEAFLFQEGYKKGERMEIEDEIFDTKFIYPYILFDNSGKKLDCIHYIEYCNQVIDDEYVDGRMTWEDIKTEWRRKQ